MRYQGNEIAKDLDRLPELFWILGTLALNSTRYNAFIPCNLYIISLQ